LSLRGVGIIFSAFGEGLKVSRMSVWRAVQEKGEQLHRRAKAQQHKHKVRVLGVDGAWIRLNGQTPGVMVAVDMGNGQMVSMEVVDEHNPQAVCKWLKPVVAEFGVEVIVTDDLTTYNTVEQERGAALGVPATNNLTEQMIGNGKVRSRTIRGYKSKDGVLAAFLICAARLV